MFAAEFQPAALDSRRRAKRAAVSLDARLGTAARTLCKVIDVSAQGAKLQTYSALKRGSTIWLTLPVVGAVAADVMWADDFLAGCQFHKPLTEQRFTDLLEHDRG